MKTEIITFIIICVLAYLLGSFISTSFNIKEWHIALRGSIGIGGILMAFIAFGIANDAKK